MDIPLRVVNVLRVWDWFPLFCRQSVETQEEPLTKTNVLYSLVLSILWMIRTLCSIRTVLVRLWINGGVKIRVLKKRPEHFQNLPFWGNKYSFFKVIQNLLSHFFVLCQKNTIFICNVYENINIWTTFLEHFFSPKIAEFFWNPDPFEFCFTFLYLNVF